jgi:3-deoxy-D-manno-octulosonic-acid transferase
VRIILLYRLIQLFSVPVTFLYFVLRILANRKYASNFRERLGFLPRGFHRTAPGAIWLHAVSAGEISTAVPLLVELRKQEPRLCIFVSTSTLAGRAAAVTRLAELADGVFYAPLDFISSVRRVLRTIKPSLVLILETEIWPNLYTEVKRTGASLVIANARISDKSWPHYRSMKSFFSQVLRQADIIFPQSVTDRDRYYRLGVPLSRLHLEGNLKYDASTAAPSVSLPTFGASPIWIAASTVAPGESRHYKHDIDEDDLILDTFEKLQPRFPGLLLIVAPRQPARFDAVARKLETRRIPFVRRTEIKNDPNLSLQLPGVLLLDTIGELAGIFSRADVVFVGGSLAPRGGHNIVEPAASGTAIITGPHMENFAAMARDLLDAGAMVQVGTVEELERTVAGLFLDPGKARNMARCAQLFVQHKQGTAERIAHKLWPLYWGATPKNPHGLFALLILAPAARLWTWGGYLKARRDQAHQQRLPLPVISIGSVTIGGAGKTPLTVYLADELQRRGHRPAILTRGYRRRTPARNIILPPGAEVSPSLTGDEAQIFLRAGTCPVGIGAHRAETGRLLMQYHSVTLFLLDDGFQHRRLYRDVDIVVIDGLMPFGHQHTVPLGRLREPLNALARAAALVITRAENDLRFALLSKRLRRYNPQAPIFRVFTRPRQWRMCQQRVTVNELPSRRVAAFCALGNPQGFWNTLIQMDFHVVFKWSFPDHHVYQPAELKRLALQAQNAGADMLVTTEKDRINFPAEFAAMVAPLEIAWLEIENTLDHEREFFDWLEAKLAAASGTVPPGKIIGHFAD